MTQIDWKTVPAGATHYDPVDCNHLKQINKHAKIWNIHAGWVDKSWQYPEDLSTMPRLILLTSWNGDGHPPVDIICEITTNDGHNWRTVKIIFFDDYVTMVGEADGKVNRELFKRCDADVAFRPIRTPEQIKEDERAEAIEAMAKSSLYGHYAFTSAQAKIACTVLFDAGYRKMMSDAEEVKA